MKSVLILSPHFPPSTLAGVHRARHLAKHLPAFGWKPIIIHAHPRFYTETGDPALASLVPQCVEQIGTDAIPAGLARMVGVGDIGIRGYWFFARALRRAARTFEARAVMITGSPFYPMLLSGMVQKRLGLPVVLDFQDPWVSRQGATRPPLSKAGLAHHLSVALEPIAVRHASWITSVSKNQNFEMADRYPWLDQQTMSAIPIGGDPEDFEALRTTTIRAPHVELDPFNLHFCYVGTLLPRAGPIVRTLFRAVSRLRVTHPAIAERLRLVFVGASNQPPGANPIPDVVRPLARAENVEDMLIEYAPRVPFLEALSILSKAHAVLMIGSDEPHYTASKIYPGLMCGRPWLSVFHQASSAHEILARAGGGAAFSFDHLNALPALENPLMRAVVHIAENPNHYGRADSAAYSSYTASAVAKTFSFVLEQVSRTAERGKP